LLHQQLTRAYRKQLMVYHPDKTGRGDQDSVFLAIQEAHDTLVNTEKRRAYDSQNEFDDTIPTGNEKPEKFYKLYGDCFKLNGRFAVKKPVPELGDDDTPIEEVKFILLVFVCFRIDLCKHCNSFIKLSSCSFLNSSSLCSLALCPGICVLQLLGEVRVLAQLRVFRGARAQPRPGQ
jgi:curved DNA-binding protein CbpA